MSNKGSYDGWEEFVSVCGRKRARELIKHFREIENWIVSIKYDDLRNRWIIYRKKEGNENECKKH